MNWEDFQKEFNECLEEMKEHLQGEPLQRFKMEILADSDGAGFKVTRIEDRELYAEN